MAPRMQRTAAVTVEARGEFREGFYGCKQGDGMLVLRLYILHGVGIECMSPRPEENCHTCTVEQPRGIVIWMPFHDDIHT